ncbi:MAG: cytochrome c oxidase subunit 3 [Pseudolabrys sp.]
MPEPQPAFQFADLRQQHDVAQLGMWVFLATEVLFFGGLILAYSAYRIGYTEGFAEAARHTKIVIGAVNTAVLLTSSFLVAWAVIVARLREGRVAAVLLWAAATLGVIFLVLKGVEYTEEYHEHLVPGLNFAVAGSHAGAIKLFFAFYFVATGLHAVHLAVGIVVLIVIGVRAKQNAYSDRYHAPITVAGLYWHFVDIVWIFLFALIYLPGRTP